MPKLSLLPDKPYKGINDSAKDYVKRNYLLLVAANFFNKLADTLSSAKIVLPWLLNSIGAPTFLSGILVPIRESGSLLPQIFVGSKLQSRPIRKHWYVGGVVAQTVCIALMAITAIMASGLMAGLIIVVLLAVLSVARAVCSLTSKDVLGKTIPKANRGRLMGLSGTLSGLVSICVGVGLSFGVLNSGNEYVLLAFAVVFSICTALLFTLVREFAGETDAANSVKAQLSDSWQLLRSDSVFSHFVMVRAFMMSSSLAAPYFVLLAQQNSDQNSLAGLGLFIVVSGVASFVSSALWGRYADQSSRKVLLITSVLTASLCTIGAIVSRYALLDSQLFPLFLFFLLSLTHQGVRLGRKTYVVDIADGNQRTRYVATSNTVIGILLLLTGSLGALASQASIALVFMIFAVMALTALMLGWRLPETQD